MPACAASDDRGAVTGMLAVSVERAAATASRWTVASLGVVGAGVSAVAVTFIVQGAAPHEAAGRAVLELLVIGAPLAAGLYAIGGRRDVRFGAILVGTGFAWSL